MNKIVLDRLASRLGVEIPYGAKPPLRADILDMIVRHVTGGSGHACGGKYAANLPKKGVFLIIARELRIAGDINGMNRASLIQSIVEDLMYGGRSLPGYVARRGNANICPIANNEEDEEKERGGGRCVPSGHPMGGAHISPILRDERSGKRPRVASESNGEFSCMGALVENRIVGKRHVVAPDSRGEFARTVQIAGGGIGRGLHQSGVPARINQLAGGVGRVNLRVPLSGDRGRGPRKKAHGQAGRATREGTVKSAGAKKIVQGTGDKKVRTRRGRFVESEQFRRQADGVKGTYFNEDYENWINNHVPDVQIR